MLGYAMLIEENDVREMIMQSLLISKCNLFRIMQVPGEHTDALRANFRLPRSNNYFDCPCCIHNKNANT